MTTNAMLTHTEAFANSKLLEKFDSLSPKEIYGFGVKGRIFKLVKSTDNFFTKIWYSLLNFFKRIKADNRSISQLKQYTDAHVSGEDYKNWQKTNYKITPLGIKNLIQESEDLKQKIAEEQKKSADSFSACGMLQNQLDSFRDDNDRLKSSLQKLEDKNKALTSRKNELKDKQKTRKKVLHTPEEFELPASPTAPVTAAAPLAPITLPPGISVTSCDTDNIKKHKEHKQHSHLLGTHHSFHKSSSNAVKDVEAKKPF